MSKSSFTAKAETTSDYFTLGSDAARDSGERMVFLSESECNASTGSPKKDYFVDALPESKVTLSARVSRDDISRQRLREAILRGLSE